MELCTHFAQGSTDVLISSDEAIPILIYFNHYSFYFISAVIILGSIVKVINEMILGFDLSLFPSFNLK